MKVVCDNCRAVYKIPNTKLKKPVNKATCRNCGHRMLIPRPKPGSDPNERVLVTAVPPTPASPPPRVEGPATKPIDDEPEATLPGRPPAGFPGTPVPVRQRESVTRSAVSAPPPTEPKTRPTPRQTKPAPAPTQPSRRPPQAQPKPQPKPQPAPRQRQPQAARGQAKVATAKKAPAPKVAPAAPAPRKPTPQPASPRQGLAVGRAKKRTPAPSPPRQKKIEPRVMRHPIPPPVEFPGTPEPSPRRPGPEDTVPSPGGRAVANQSFQLEYHAPGKEVFAPGQETQPPHPSPLPPRAPSFNPAGDLAWAVIGTLCALFGAFMLASITMVNDDYWRTGLSGLGLLFAITGSMTTLLILLTGGRGTRKARVFLSILVSGFFSSTLSALAVSTGIAAITLLREAEQIEFSAPPPRAPVPAPAVAAAPQPAAPATAEGDGAADAAVAAPAPAPVPRAAPRPRPAPRGQPRPAPVAAPMPVAAPQPAPMPAPVDVTAPAVPAGVPMDVVEVMLYNNLGVKKCFVPLFKTGNVPPRVDVRFTIQPTGQVSGATLQQANLQGTDFEGCMRKAVLNINFPPFSGPPQTLTFPFVLNR